MPDFIHFFSVLTVWTPWSFKHTDFVVMLLFNCRITACFLKPLWPKHFTQNIQFWVNDFHHINNETVPVASEPGLKSSNFPLWGGVQSAQTGSRLTALVKLESSPLNQVVLTVWLVCHSYWQEISVNGPALRRHAPPLPIDSGSVSYGHKVTKTGFAHQYETWHNTQPNVISTSTAQNNTHTHKVKWHRFKYFNIIQSMSLFAFTQASPQTARQSLHKAECRSAAPWQDQLCCLLVFLPASELLSLSPAAGAAGWTASGSSSVLCFLSGGKKSSFSPLHLLYSLLQLYHSSGSFFTMAYHKDILWHHFSLSRDRYINKASCLWLLF